jgi:protein-arginine kinase
MLDKNHQELSSVSMMEIQSGAISDTLPENNIRDNNNSYILSMRIRLARNFKSIHYPGRLTKQKKDLLSKIIFSDKNVLKQWLNGKNNEIHRKAYTHDEDHLRVQWIIPCAGYPLDDIHNILDSILEEIHVLDGFYEWQFHNNYGYLTACPGNTGTGMRISFRLNVRGLKHSGNWPHWRKTLKEAGLVIRGHKGEGSPETEFVEISSINSWNFDLKRELMRTVALIERIVMAEKGARG